MEHPIIEDNIDEKAIIVLIEQLHDRSYPPKFLLKIICLFSIYYDQMGSKILLDFAFHHVCAYLKKGYSYEGYEELFDKIVQEKTAQSLEVFIKSNDYFYKKIKFSMYSIRCALGRWHRGQKNALTKEWIAQDICNHIHAGKHGVYQYENIQRGIRKMTYVTIEENGTTYIVNHQGNAVKILPNS